ERRTGPLCFDGRLQRDEALQVRQRGYVQVFERQRGVRDSDTFEGWKLWLSALFCWLRDAGCGMRDAGCGMRDAGCGMRDTSSMDRVQGYKKLEIWQLARKTAAEIHRISLKFPKFEMYEEGSQIRRSSKSVRSNIVEG